MEKFFEHFQEEPTTGDINVCIFPHLKQVLVVDLRYEDAIVQVIEAQDVFDDVFFNHLEGEFRRILREQTEYPFSHMLNISMRVEEVVREAGMAAILEKLGQTESVEEQPLVAVFVITGSTISTGETDIGHILQALLGETLDTRIQRECTQLLTHLVSQERAVMKEMEQDEMREILEEESPNFYTLWQQRN